MRGKSADGRLGSWKEIAAFFGKDERTVKRWEAQRGLPVHRVPGGNRTTVYAYTRELEDWLRRDSAPTPLVTELSPAASEVTSPSAIRSPPRLAFAIALGALILVSATAAPQVDHAGE